jgi:hypothetical protein
MEGLTLFEETPYVIQDGNTAMMLSPGRGGEG